MVLRGTLALVASAVTLVGAEAVLRLSGFGDPVVYEVHRDYGYRLRPNQLVRRFGGATIRINNLGIRALSDWTSPDQKVLFLGDSVTYGGSYVTTADLFAVKAVPDGWEGGSAGTNGWGVENIHGLVVRHGFTPAVAYVTVLIERDFHRGFTQRGPLYRTSKPSSAISELVPHVWLNLQARLRWSHEASSQNEAPTGGDRITRAVNHLVDLDRFLKERGFVHIIFLSPTRSNVIGGEPPDATVTSELARARIHVNRLADRVRLVGLTPSEQSALFHDDFHLTAQGHAVWSRLMRQDVEEAVSRATESGTTVVPTETGTAVGRQRFRYGGMTR